MRSCLLTALVLVCLPTPDVARAQQSIVAIHNVTIIPGTNAAPVPRATIVIQGRRIAAVGSSRTIQVPADARVIDGGGRYVIPGLIDTHVHIASDVGTPRLERVLGYLLANGVTGVRDAGSLGRERELCALRERIETGELLAPRLYVSGSATPQNRERYQARDWQDLIRQLRDIGVDGIKLRNLTRADANAVIPIARALGLPTYGHTYGPGFSLDNFSLDALEAGVSGIMHVSGTGPADSEQPRTLAATDWQRTWLSLYLRWLDASPQQEDRFLKALLSHSAWLEPTLAVESFIVDDERYRNRAETRLLWTPYEQVRSGFPAFTGGDLELARQGFKRMLMFVNRFQKAGGRILAGTDMLPWPGGLHEELRLLAGAGLSPLAALQTATWNPARAMGWDGRTGTIAPGKDADLVLLDGDPLRDITNTTRIWAVVRAGHIVDREALDRLLNR